MDETPEHPDEALFEDIEELWEANADITRAHRHFVCRGIGVVLSRPTQTRRGRIHSGCPKCNALTGDPFAGFKIRSELDYLCDRKDPLMMPDFLNGEEL
jgi:hypothetical protein